MFETMLNYPNSLYGQFERMRRDLDDIFGAPALASSIRSVTSGTLPAINVGHTASERRIYASESSSDLFPLLREHLQSAVRHFKGHYVVV